MFNSNQEKFHTIQDVEFPRSTVVGVESAIGLIAFGPKSNKPIIAKQQFEASVDTCVQQCITFFWLTELDLHGTVQIIDWSKICPVQIVYT